MTINAKVNPFDANSNLFYLGDCGDRGTTSEKDEELSSQRGEAT